MTISRRDILFGPAALGVGLALRPLTAAPLPREADIVVIGAGAAGLAAARRISAANRKVVVVEANDRVGGRCETDSASFAVPFDRGARWLYAQDSNPVAALARPAAVDLYAAPQSQKIRIGRRNARSGEVEDFLTSSVRANRAIADAGRGRADMPAADALPKDLDPWTGTLAFMLGPAATSKDLKEVSAFDLARSEPRDAGVFCRQGLGTFMTKLAENVPVALSTPVTRVNWGGRGLEIETPAGRLNAQAVIVTASTAVLAAGNIKFVPDLPKRQLDAVSKLRLGSYDRIALELTGNPLGLARDDVVIEQGNDRRTALLRANIAGSTLCAVDVAGSFGNELSVNGEQAMIAFAVEWLTRLYGSDVKSAVGRSRVTRWNAAPTIMGAMSVASVGGQTSRKILMEPLNAVFFAGEAVHETLWGTVAGAWESGERAAEAALRKIGALKPIAEEPQPRPRRRTRSSAPPR